MQRRLLSLLAMTLLIIAIPFCTSTAFAQDDDEDDGKGRGFIKAPFNAKPEKEHHDGITTNVFTLRPESDDEKVRGVVRVVCYSDDKDSFRMDLTGLNPKAVYTVWFTSSSKAGAERAGIGTEPFSFKPTGGGKTLYQAPLLTCPLIRYKWVEVRLHPDGNAKNVDTSVRVLKARLIAE